MVICPCGEFVVGEKCPFLEWVDPPMCPHDVDIIFGLLRNRNQLEDLLDMTEERADFEERRANTEETKANMVQIRDNVEHEKPTRSMTVQIE
nr:zinc finger, GRF-type [Tanacetum cinerariifolium]